MQIKIFGHKLQIIFHNIHNRIILNRSVHACSITKDYFRTEI